MSGGISGRTVLVAILLAGFAGVVVGRLAPDSEPAVWIAGGIVLLAALRIGEML